MTILQKTRIAVGLKQCQLAQKSGISISNLSRYENGWAKPSYLTATKLAKELACKVEDLFPAMEVNNDDNK